MKNLSVSVVLPVESSKHKNFESLFSSCVTSIKNQILVDNKGETVIDDIELVLVHSGEESLVSFINEFDFSGLTTNIVHNEGETDFCTQINYGVV